MEQPQLKAFLTIYEVKKNGKLVRKYRKEAESFVVTFPTIWLGYMQYSNTSPIDTGNAARQLDCTNDDNGPRWLMYAGAGDPTYGIVVGSGSTAVTVTDYKLGTLIANGTSTGQLLYGGTTCGIPTTDSTKNFLDIYRLLTNGTTSAVTINEVGMYTYCRDYQGTGRYFCIVRDLIAGGYSIAAGSTVVVMYEWQATA